MTETMKIIKVGIADLGIVESPNLIRTSGLGSCVGVVVYDVQRELAGMVHIMLPEASLAKSEIINEAKYADTGIKLLVNKLVQRGAKSYSLKAKIAGGAQMFQFASKNDMMRIGPRNIDATRYALEHLRIKIVSEDVGGNSGRTIEFNPKTRLLNIRTVNQGVKDI